MNPSDVACCCVAAADGQLQQLCCCSWPSMPSGPHRAHVTDPKVSQLRSSVTRVCGIITMNSCNTAAATAAALLQLIVIDSSRDIKNSRDINFTTDNIHSTGVMYLGVTTPRV